MKINHHIRYSNLNHTSLQMYLLLHKENALDFYVQFNDFIVIFFTFKCKSFDSSRLFFVVAQVSLCHLNFLVQMPSAKNRSTCIYLHVPYVTSRCYMVFDFLCISLYIFTADDMGLGKTLTMISLVLKQQQLKAKEEKEDEWLSTEKQLGKGQE